MIILGILLVAAAVVAAVELILANHGHDSQVAVHIWRWTPHVDAFWLAVAGAGLLVVAWLGVVMLMAGSRRARRLRRERRELARENRRLAERADQAESSLPAAGHGYGPADTLAPPPGAAGHGYRPTDTPAPPPVAPGHGYGPVAAAGSPDAAQQLPGDYPARAADPYAGERVEGRPLEP